MDNIAHLKGHSDFGYTIDTANNARLVAELVDEADIVYHLAAAVGVQLIVESPVRTTPETPLRRLPSIPGQSATHVARSRNSSGEGAVTSVLGLVPHPLGTYGLLWAPWEPRS